MGVSRSSARKQRERAARDRQQKRWESLAGPVTVHFVEVGQPLPRVRTSCSECGSDIAWVDAEDGSSTWSCSACGEGGSVTRPLGL